MSYFLIALADEKTNIDHALPCCFISSSSSSARFLYSRKFSSIMKNVLHAERASRFRT